MILPTVLGIFDMHRPISLTITSIDSILINFTSNIVDVNKNYALVSLVPKLGLFIFGTFIKF